MTILANLRAVGTSPNNPAAGELVCAIELPLDTDPSSPPALVHIAVRESYAIYAPGLTGFSITPPLEYIGAVPVEVRPAGA
jgi:hypothetical protein